MRALIRRAVDLLAGGRDHDRFERLHRRARTLIWLTVVFLVVGENLKNRWSTAMMCLALVSTAMIFLLLAKRDLVIREEFRPCSRCDGTGLEPRA